MSKEAKVNLTFLVALLLLSFPGVVMMVRKQLQPGARRLADPPHVRRTEAYNNPQPAGSWSLRIVPPLTAQWVEQVSRKHLGARPLQHEAAGGRIEPVMSEGRRFELIGLQRSDQGTTVTLLGWMNELGSGQVSAIEANAGWAGELLSVEVEQIEVPRQTLEELKRQGYVTPPPRVGLVWLRFAPSRNQAEEEGMALQITWSSGAGQGKDVLDLARILPPVQEAAKDELSREPT